MPHLLLPFSTAFLLAAVSAQNPATYDLFGAGCNGAPTTACVTQNDVNPALSVASLPNEYAYPVINTSGVPIQVTGFDVYTVTNTAATEVGNTGVLRDASGTGATAHTVPAFTAEALGTITVTGTQGWYSTDTYPAITVQPGEAFWISLDSFSKISPSQASTGAAGPTAPHWRRPTYNANAWTASGSVARPIFRIHCLPAAPAVPSLTPIGLPQLSQNFALQVGGGTPNLIGYVMWAFDDTQWQSLPTPVDLGIFGMPHCFNYTSNDSLTLLLLDPQGQGSTAVMAIPNDPGLAGVTWFNQAAVLVPGANALDLLVTNAGKAVVGI